MDFPETPDHRGQKAKKAHQEEKAHKDSDSPDVTEHQVLRAGVVTQVRQDSPVTLAYQERRENPDAVYPDHLVTLANLDSPDVREQVCPELKANPV